MGDVAENLDTVYRGTATIANEQETYNTLCPSVAIVALAVGQAYALVKVLCTTLPGRIRLLPGSALHGTLGNAKKPTGAALPKGCPVGILLC